MNEIISNLPWVIGAVILIYLSIILIKKIVAIAVVLVIVVVVGFLMYSGAAGHKALPDFVQQIVSTGKQLIAKAEASIPTPSTYSNAPTIDSASLVVTHNKWRSQVGVPPLGWSNSLAQDAQGWADKLKEKNNCAMVHATQQQGKEQGENLFWASARTKTWLDGKVEVEVQNISTAFIVDDWASEIRDYNYVTNECDSGSMCGHYTQIVWRKSQEVGCGMAICPDKSQVWVCRYNPPGNYKGKRPY